MISQFSVANYRSIHDLQTLNFRPTGLTSEDKNVDADNIVRLDEANSFLKIIGVYGPNASGKSSLLKALGFLKQMVSYSLESENVLKYQQNQFKLSTEHPEHCGRFEIVLVLDGRKYKYGFSLAINGHILSEWLYGPADKNETYYFVRNGAEISINEDRFREGTQLPWANKLRSDTLFLTFCSSYDGEISSEIKDFITHNIIVEGGGIGSRFPSYMSGRGNKRTNGLIKNGGKHIILNWMNEAGLSVDDIELQEIERNKIKYGYDVFLTKNVFDAKGEVVDKVTMNLEYDESEGTKKFYSYIGALWEIFQTGGLYISDEIDNNFHPSLLLKVIKLFQNPNINRAGAQLLYTSHDINLMDSRVMRRDQFYFTEKNHLQETRLFSLANLKGIRNNADFARQYLAGLYGALPQLGHFRDLNILGDDRS